jgi:hypothetical protein
MATPTAELHSDFSSPGAVARPWEDATDALEAAEIFWLSTVRRDGRPHVTPLPAMWLDDALHFCTGPAEQKARNLEGNPQCVLTTGNNLYGSGLDVMVEGPEIWLVTHGRFELLGPRSPSLTLTPTRSAFVSAATATLTLRGNGRIFRARVAA